MNTKFEFIRQIRTLTSEVYTIFIDDNEDVDGRLDIHYINDNYVSALLSLYKDFNDDDINVLLTAIDDQIINTADIDKGNLYIEVNFVSKVNGYGKAKKEE